MVGEEGPALFLDGHRIVDGYPFCEILGVSKLPEASKILRSRTKRRGSHGNAFSLIIIKCMQRDDEEWVVVGRYHSKERSSKSLTLGI